MGSPGVILMRQPPRQEYKAEVFSLVSFRTFEDSAFNFPTCPRTKLLMHLYQLASNILLILGSLSSAPKSSISSSYQHTRISRICDLELVGRCRLAPTTVL